MLEAVIMGWSRSGPGRFSMRVEDSAQAFAENPAVAFSGLLAVVFSGLLAVVFSGLLGESSSHSKVSVVWNIEEECCLNYSKNSSL